MDKLTAIGIGFAFWTLISTCSDTPKPVTPETVPAQVITVKN